MLYVLYILFTSLLTFSFTLDGYVETTKTLELPSQMKFEIVQGLMVLKVPGKVGESNFLFDTGAEQLIFNAKVQNHSSTLVSLDNEYQVDDITVNELAIGSLVLKNVPAWRMDLDFLSSKLDRDISGILGASIFSENSVMIDYDNMLFTLVTEDFHDITFSSSYNVVDVSYTQNKDDLPIIQANVGGKQFNLGFDTGANLSVFDRTHTDLISEHSSFQLELDDLTINNAIISNLPYQIKDISVLNEARELTLDGIISAEALATNKIFFDPNRKKIFLFWEKLLP